jgi:hypothetical protein
MLNNCIVRVIDCYDINKTTFLNPVAHSFNVDCFQRRVISFILSENDNMINLVVTFPGGYRNSNGNYNNVSNNSYFWSSTVYSDTNAWNRKLNYNNSDVNRNNNTKRNGFSLRCVRDLKQLFLNLGRTKCN